METTIISIKPSEKKDKKFVAILSNGKKVHFGSATSQTFLEGASEEKRNAYRARASKILLKDGTPAFQKKYSPAWFAWHLLW